MTDFEILAIFVDSSDPALSTGEIADDLGMSQQGAYSRLADLVDEGLVDTKKFGQGRGWWITEDGLDHVESER